MAPKHRRGLLASLAQMAVSPGMILGIAACLIVLYACSPEQLLVWGWRVPFLVTLFTAPLSLVLRMHMPEPHEYLHSIQEMVLQRVASTAAAKVAKSFTQMHSRAGSTTSPLNNRQVSQRLMSLTSITSKGRGFSPESDQGRGPTNGTTHSTGAEIVALNLPGLQNTFRSKDPAALGIASRDVKNSHHGPSASVPAQRSSNRSHTWQDFKARELSVRSEVQLRYDHKNDLSDLGCEAEFATECEELAHKIKRHRPIAVLFKGHWKGLVLQFFLEGVYGALFYVFFSWVPSYLHTSTGVSIELTLWALMIGLGLFAITVPVTGHFTDKGIPKVWVYMGISLIGAAVVIPVMYALHSGSLAAMFTLVPFMIGLCGCLGGLMTSIGPQIYPAGVRATGYNLGALRIVGQQQAAFVFVFVTARGCQDTPSCGRTSNMAGEPQTLASWAGGTRCAEFSSTDLLLLLLFMHAGHNLAMSLWGGLTPFIVSAMALGMQPAALAAGVLIVVIAVVSWIAAIPLIAIAPQTNAIEGWSCCGLLETETEMTGSTHIGSLA
eukprot:GHUV01010319.1.p1 GENE.GHUV01010319.1~~GHUV01010319.1.p1  ORF type:complete len:550 (+),score=105.42 GHUV01010319.1:1185-2834(+)